jgi:hypothetical protein
MNPPFAEGSSAALTCRRVCRLRVSFLEYVRFMNGLQLFVTLSSGCRWIVSPERERHASGLRSTPSAAMLPTAVRVAASMPFSVAAAAPNLHVSPSAPRHHSNRNCACPFDQGLEQSAVADSTSLHSTAASDETSRIRTSRLRSSASRSVGGRSPASGDASPRPSAGRDPGVPSGVTDRWAETGRHAS